MAKLRRRFCEQGDPARARPPCLTNLTTTTITNPTEIYDSMKTPQIGLQRGMAQGVKSHRHHAR